MRGLAALLPPAASPRSTTRGRLLNVRRRLTHDQVAGVRKLLMRGWSRDAVRLATGHGKGTINKIARGEYVAQEDLQPPVDMTGQS